MKIWDARRAVRAMITGAAPSNGVIDGDDGEVRAGVPQRLGRTIEAGDMTIACGQHDRFTIPAFRKRRLDAITAKEVRNWFDCC